MTSPPSQSGKFRSASDDAAKLIGCGEQRYGAITEGWVVGPLFKYTRMQQIQRIGTKTPQQLAARRERRRRNRIRRSQSRVVVVRQKSTTRQAPPKQRMPHYQDLPRKMGSNKLALAMALPAQHMGVRFPTRDMPRCSIVGGRDILAVRNVNLATAGWNQGDLVVHFYGQPGRNFVYTVSQSSASGFLNHSYDVHFSSGDAWWTISPLAFAANESPLVVNQFWPAVGARSSISPAGLHGPALAAGLSNGIAYFLLSETNYIYVNPTDWTSTLVGYAFFEVYKYVGPGMPPVLVYDKPITLASGNIPGTSIFSPGSSDAGYYALKFDRIESTSGAIGSSNNAISVKINMTSSATPTRTIWSQVSMGELDANGYGDAKIGESVRITGNSMLLTNTASMYNAAGTIVAARTKTPLFTDVTASTLARAAEKYTNHSRLGVYTFKEFSESAESFRNVVSERIGFMSFDLDYDDYVHTVQAGCNDPATQPNTFELVVEYNAEFVTEAQRYVKGVSQLPFEALVEARRHINSKPEWFYENPLHMRDIYNWVLDKGAQAGKAMIRGAPRALQYAGMVDPGRAGAYSALAQLMSGLNV